MHVFLKPASVICEIMKDDGDMARLEDLKSIAIKHNFKIATIADLISYRLEKEKFVNRVAEAELPTEFGTFKSIVYESEINPVHHVALVKGEIDPNKDILVRVHSESLISDVFNTKNCDSRAKLIKSMEIIEEEGTGVILYIRSESHGNSLVNKIIEYSIKGKISDPMDGNDDFQYKSELRNYGVGAQILRDLNVRNIRLLSNNNKKVKGLEGFGLKIVEKLKLDIAEDKREFVKLKSIS